MIGARRLGWTVVLGALAVPWGSVPSAGAGAVDAPRVLVLSLPTLAWDDLYRGDTPAIDDLLGESAVGAMSVRNVLPETDAADGYAAMSAGTRARGVPISGQVLEPEEDYFGTPARTIFTRHNGFQTDTGLLAFGLPALVERNNGLDYDADVGALGQALADAGIPRAAVANADGFVHGRGGTLLRDAPYQRAAASSLMDERGWVPAGAVTRDLLEEDPAAPFGVRYAPDAVMAAFSEAWAAGGVVLVEGSDLARVDRYLPLTTSAHRMVLRRNALRATDALVARMLKSVDRERDKVLVVAPYHRSGVIHLTVAGLRAPGQAPGLLQSGSTRRSGLVTLVDVAPTVLDLVGLDRPASMEGRRFERSAGGAETGEARAGDLAQIDEASQYRDRMVVPVAIVFSVLQAGLWIGAAVAVRTGGARARRRVGTAALAMLAYLPATYLAGLVSFAEAPAPAYWFFVGGVASVLAILATVAGGRRALDPLLLCLGLVFGLLAADMVMGAPLQMNTVFGYSPTVGGRFAGMGNLAYGQFAAAAFLLCGLLTRRLSGRSFGTAIAFSVLVVAILIDGMPFWGSDVGGVLAFVPAVGVTAARLLGRRVRWRSVALWATASAGVVAFFAALDLSRPADRRTHLGRLVEAVADQGLGPFETVASRKLEANLAVITSSVWTAMVPIGLACIVYLLWRAPGHVRSIRDTIQESLAGLAVVGFLGFALNDSGIAVPGLMLGVVNASLVYLTVRTLPAEPAP